MEKEEYTKLMPLVNPRLYKSTLNKEMKQKRKEAQLEKELQEQSAKKQADKNVSEEDFVMPT